MTTTGKHVRKPVRAARSGRAVAAVRARGEGKRGPAHSTGWTTSGFLSDLVMSLIPEGTIDGDPTGTHVFTPTIPHIAPPPLPALAASPPRSALAHVNGGRAGILLGSGR